MLKGYKIKVDILRKFLTVPMVFKTPEGVEIIKTFTFTQGQYQLLSNIKLLTVANKTGKVRCLDS